MCREKASENHRRKKELWKKTRPFKLPRYQLRISFVFACNFGYDSFGFDKLYGVINPCNFALM